LQGLTTRAILLRRVPSLRDPLGELRLRRRIVAQRPGDLTQLAFYFSAAVRLAGDSAAGAAVPADAQGGRRRYVDLLGTALRLWTEPGLAERRAEWSSPLQVTTDERLEGLR